MNITVDLGQCIPHLPNHCFHFPPAALMVFNTILDREKIVVPVINTSVTAMLIRNNLRSWDENTISPPLQFGSVPPEHCISGPGGLLSGPLPDCYESTYKTSSRFLNVVPGSKDKEFKPYALRQFHSPFNRLSD